MAVATKSSLELAVELVRRYSQGERATILQEISSNGTYKGESAERLLGTIAQYYDHYDRYKPLVDRLNYLSTGEGLNKASEELRHIQTKPDETHKIPEPPEPPEKDVIDKFADQQVRGFKRDAAKKIAQDNKLEAESKELQGKLEDEQKKLEEQEKLAEERKTQATVQSKNVLGQVDASSLTANERARKVGIEDLQSRIKDNQSKRLSPAERLAYGSFKTLRDIELLKRKATQYDENGDVVDQTIENAKHHAEIELKTKGQEVIQKWLTRRFGPSIEYPKNISPGGVNIPSPISDLTDMGSSVAQNAASNILRNAASKVAQAAVQGAARIGIATAATASSPALGIAFVVGVIAIVLIIFFYFEANTFAPYNPVPIPQPESIVTGVGGGPVPPPNSSSSVLVNWALDIVNHLQVGSYVDPDTNTQGYDEMETNITNGTYQASLRAGEDSGVGPSGLYWCTNLVIDTYNLAGIPGLGADQQGVINMLNFWINNSSSGYQFYDYQKNAQSALQSLQIGQVMFMAKDRTQYLGQEHVAIVSDKFIDANGNGHITTLNSNSRNIIITYTVTNWTILRPIYNVVGFGGHS